MRRGPLLPFLLFVVVLGAISAALVVHFGPGSGLSPAATRLPQRGLRQLLRLGRQPRYLAPGRIELHTQPGDVAVYGLDTTAVTAAHVAVVTATAGDRAAPDVVTGDGDRTGYNVVEVGDHKAFADVKEKGAPLSGYVSPSAPATPSASY